MAFWDAISTTFELADHELILLREAARTIDLLDVLQVAIDHDGPLQRWGRRVAGASRRAGAATTQNCLGPFAGGDGHPC